MIVKISDQSILLGLSREAIRQCNYHDRARHDADSAAWDSIAQAALEAVKTRSCLLIGSEHSFPSPVLSVVDKT